VARPQQDASRQHEHADDDDGYESDAATIGEQVGHVANHDNRSVTRL
jgi:hypothetical protein